MPKEEVAKKTAIKKRRTTTSKVGSKTTVSQTSIKESILPLKNINNLTSSVKNSLTNITKYHPTKTFYLIVLAVALLLLFSLKKSWFVAATVNSSPISNFELLSRLNNQYRQQVLTQMVNETIVLNEAKKKNIVIKNSEIDDKISQLESNVGGPEALNALLSQQGLTRDNLRSQVNIQLVVEKLYSQEATVSAEEIKEFVDQNKDQLTATDSAGQAKEAEEVLKQQKISQIFGQKFEELKSKANVKIF